ncbi:MAG: homoserine dehydrogenase [Ruminococcus sp.]|nr:homoserine dehydrogenase [Ruminococcus sp.]MBQ1381161.1 homoserine dehydrogenase [Ruminococcus sp.]MBQ1601717.1 homoserine dehydrogenase [Ruminococcus sp.]MBQ1638345.1 homoserine dehydrogenase [Ruminococcus sp.]MBQ1686276.1 homoserine dehydrogenase [Ruminococcus sp.]
MVSVAIMGHGVVGSGVAEILLTHKQKLFAGLGEEIYIKKILDLREFPDSPIADRFTKDFEEIINDREIRVVAEVMGGLRPAYDFVKRCLKAGKSVVTSNKELVAAHGAELLAIAKEENVNFMFEASVGGGIPIIRPMNQCLVANKVGEVAGILNGTTNFILTKMIQDGMTFADALKLAQDLGFAERNPAADIEGHDACRKICILASLAYGRHVYPESVHTEGITAITLEDVNMAEAFGYVIKLIGRVKKLDDGKIDIITAPMLVPFKSQLSNIDNEFNGIMVRGDCTGDVVFYGKGAGKLPTASAVVADIVDCCKHLKARRFLFWADGDGSNIIDWRDSVSAMFVRLTGDDAVAKAEKVFGEITTVSGGSELGVLTGEMSYREFESKCQALEADGVQVLTGIRIGDI